MTCCPSCGSELHDQFMWDGLNGVFIANGKAVRFTKHQALVVDAMWKARGRGGIRSVEEFIRKVYAGDINGGPLCTNVISVHLHRIRKKLEGSGYTVPKNEGRPKRGYRIAKLEGASA